MDFWQTMLVLLRRWYVAVPVLAITLGITALAFLSVPTTYTATGTAVLTVPPAGASLDSTGEKSKGIINPLLAFDGSLSIAAKLEVQTLKDPTVLARLAAQGGTAVIEAGDGGLAGPFVVVVAESPSAAISQKTVELAFQHVQQELIDRQTSLGAPRSTYINVEQVVPAAPGDPKVGGKVRAAGVALALGLIASLASAFFVESFLQRRRRPEQLGDGLLGDPEPNGLPMNDGGFGRVPVGAAAVAQAGNGSNVPLPTAPPSDGVDRAPRVLSDAEATVRVPTVSRPSPVRRPAPVPRPRPTLSVADGNGNGNGNGHPHLDGHGSAERVN